MWKNYSAGYFKNNRAMMAFIMTVALFAGTLISFISHYFYNLFEDYVYRSCSPATMSACEGTMSTLM